MIALLLTIVATGLGSVSPDISEYHVGSEQGLPTQFVLVSFDATPRGDVPPEKYRFVQMLKRIRNAAPPNDSGPAPSFTFFFNTMILQLRNGWVPPAHTRWARNNSWQRLRKNPDLHQSRVIGHGQNPGTITTAVATLKHMLKMGMELASHGVRHYSGREWTMEQWQAEFAEHARILALHKLPKPAGYRAPFLQTGKAGFARADDPAFHVMQAYGMHYDSSKGSRLQHRWPRRVGATGIWEIEIPTYRQKDGPMLLFGKSGTNKWAFIHILREQFEQRYHTNRAPLVLGGHGEFSSITERFLIEVCYRPGVHCATYSEFIQYLECHPELEGRTQLL